MTQVLRVEGGAMIETMHDSAWCHDCGAGYTLPNRYNVWPGQPCELCGKPLVYERRVHRWREPAVTVVRCDCGREVRCAAFTNECACGQLFNACGQRLAPCSQWEEATGNDDSDLDAEGVPLV